MIPPLILASTSCYRQELLTRLRIPFQSVAPGVDEENGHGSVHAPEDLARDLARAKAMAVAGRFQDAVVIGSDQVASIGSTILSKPGSADRAREQLTKLAGNTHQLATAVCIASPGRVDETVDITRLTMRKLSTQAINRYVLADMPIDCAGAYKIESLGISLFERVETADPTAIVGLPLTFVAEILRRLGFDVP
jgi:septum formation protein